VKSARGLRQLVPTQLAPALVLALLAGPLLSCDAISSVTNLFEPEWKVSEANGDDGAFHFVMNAFDLRIGYPEHVRVERIETRTIKKSGGATEEQTRERKVRVIMARCESKSICDAEPHAEDTREIVVTPKIFGVTRIYVTAIVDETDQMKDAVRVKVQ
jgi:hypothetical protein